MYIMLFVKCKKSFQSFQHAKNQFFFGVCNRLLACQGGSCGKTEFYFIDYIFHLFILDWIFLHESEFEPLVPLENQMVYRK